MRLSATKNGAISTGRGLGNELWDKAGTAPSLDLPFADNKSLVDATTGSNLVTFTRASSGTFVGSDGVLQTAANDVPRFDHNPITGESLGLLVEEQRSNLAVQSENFGTTWTTLGLLAFGSGSTLDAIAAPNGQITADLVTEDSANSEHRIGSAAISWAGNTPYTFTLHVKSAGRTRFDFLLGTGSNWSGGRQVVFDLSNGTINGTDGAIGSITPYPNGWYRCRITVLTVASPSASSIFLRFLDSINSSVYTGDGTSGIYLWGAQLEAGAFPTSYIKSEAAAVTRSADVASIGSSAFTSFYNQSQGSVFVQSALLANVNTYEASFTDNTNNNHHYLRYIGTQHQVVSAVGGVANTSIFSDFGGSQLSARTAYAYGSNAYQVSTNGGLGAFSSTTGGIPSTVDRLNIGFSQVSGATGNLWIRRLCYWRQALPGSTLQAITG